MYSSTIAPNAQQIVSRKDMLKMSNCLRRAMFRQHAYQFERHTRGTESQHVTDAQRHATGDAFVVHVGAVSAVVFDNGLAVLLHDRAVRLGQAGNAGGQAQRARRLGDGPAQASAAPP